MFMILKLVMSLLLTVLICGCSPTSLAPLTPQNVVGTFKGSYGGADETFVFLPAMGLLPKSFLLQINLNTPMTVNGRSQGIRSNC